MILHGWGRYPRFDSEMVHLRSPSDVRLITGGQSGIVARGNGRAYGDAAIGERVTLSTHGLNRMKAFDPATGSLTVEAGVLLSDILQHFVPRGFFPPVVPGTRLVSVGGMIASDVHGKNHHRDGSFGQHVEHFKLVLPGGETVTCSPHENAPLFTATLGGMGLTGIIVEATFTMKRLETGWVRQKVSAANDLGSALKALDETGGSTYSVAWVDGTARGASLGRSIVFSGEHASIAEIRAAGLKPGLLPPQRHSRLQVPFDLPDWALNRLTVGAFNACFFRRGAMKDGQTAFMALTPYMFPLDRVAGWNRIYGRHGLIQHQSVFPETATAAIGDALDRFVTRAPGTSFTIVLKRLGPGTGMLSFPMTGYTLAIDLHVSDGVLALLDEIDRIVVAAGGRLYLAKDARQSRATFEAGYGRLNEFKQIRRDIAADVKLASRLSKRLGL